MGSLIGVGDTVGSYRIEKKLGEGGFGAVYLAEHLGLRKKVAIKVLLSEVSKHPELVVRFTNEARAAASLQDPGIIDVSHIGQHTDGSTYFVMEFLRGQGLDALLAERGKLPPRLIAELGRQIARSLGEAHKAGIVHRDLKPANLFLVPDPETASGLRTKILDFGVAKFDAQLSGLPTMTKSTQIMGTPQYMSPEQCAGAARADARSDIYSLGCILYEMAVGLRAFSGKTTIDVLYNQAHMQPRPPRAIDPTVPEYLEWIILRCLAKEPGERFQNMGELVAAFESVAPSGVREAVWPQLTPDLLRTQVAPAEPAGGDTLAATPRARAPGQPPPLASPPTTHGSAVGQSFEAPSRPRSRKAWAIGAAGLVAVGTLVTILALKSGSGGPHPTAVGPAPQGPAHAGVAAAPAGPSPSTAPPTALAGPGPTDLRPSAPVVEPHAAVPDAGVAPAVPAKEFMREQMDLPAGSPDAGAPKGPKRTGHHHDGTSNGTVIIHR